MFASLTTELSACAAAFYPWAGGMLTRSTALLAGILVAGALFGGRRAPERHLLGILGLGCLTLLPALSLAALWQAGTAAGGSMMDLPEGARIWIAVWALGAAGLLARMGVDLLMLHVQARRRATAAPAAWQGAAGRIARRLGIRRTVHVLCSDAFDIPYTWGLLRPVIVLPRRSLAWSSHRRRAVLLHELGHVRRLDGLSAVFSRIVCALFWFHPLAWWVERRAREDAERACDRLVVEEGIAPVRYARHLLAIIRDARRPAAALAPTMAAGSPLGRRITALIDGRPTASRLGRRAVVAVALSVLAATLALATLAVPEALGGSPADDPACSDAGMPEAPSDEPDGDGPQSVEPAPADLYTPLED